MATSPDRAVIIAGGELHTDPIVRPDDRVIAADSGYDHARALGIDVDDLVGDLDSVSDDGMEHATRSNVVIDRYPTDKDETDLEIAIRVAIDEGASTVDIHGAEAGGIGHLLGVALALTHERCAEATVTWHTESGTVRAAVPDRAVEFSTQPGERISLVPVGHATGVSTSGLQWRLNDARLEPGTSIGVSNRASGTNVSVVVNDGAILVVKEGEVLQ